MSGSGREALSDVRERLGGHPRGPVGPPRGPVGLLRHSWKSSKPSRWSGRGRRPYLRYRRGREVLPEVPVGSGVHAGGA